MNHLTIWLNDACARPAPARTPSRSVQECALGARSGGSAGHAAPPLKSERRRGMTQAFVFEKLDLYRAAREALALAAGCKGALRGLPGEVAPQLERALVSVAANICA